MTLCLYSATSFYLKDTAASTLIVLIMEYKHNEQTETNLSTAKSITFRWVKNNYSKLLSGWHYLVEKQAGEKINQNTPNSYFSPQFLSDKSPIFPFLLSANVHMQLINFLKKAWTIFQLMLILCKTNCSGYRSHKMAHGLFPVSHTMDCLRNPKDKVLQLYQPHYLPNNTHFPLCAASVLLVAVIIEDSGKK